MGKKKLLNSKHWSILQPCHSLVIRCCVFIRKPAHGWQQQSGRSRFMESFTAIGKKASRRGFPR